MPFMNCLLKINIQAEYLLEASLVFTSVAVGILFFIVYYLFTFLKGKRRIQHLRNIYGEFLSEIILCETKDELIEIMQKRYVQALKTRWLYDESARKLLIKEIVNINKSLSGLSADNVQWLYVHLELFTDTLNRLKSKKWYVKAKAIQALAAMNHTDAITKIYRETNSRNTYVRTEAQLAVVKLTGADGLRFLNVLSHTVTQWQQICLLEQLPQYVLIEKTKLVKWLHSENSSVIEFALRLIERYGSYDLNAESVQCIRHPSLFVRRQAVRTLIALDQESSIQELMLLYPSASPAARIDIFQVLKHNPSADHFHFYLAATEDSNIEAALLARQIVKELEPSYIFSDQASGLLMPDAPESIAISSPQP